MAYVPNVQNQRSQNYTCNFSWVQ